MDVGARRHRSRRFLDRAAVERLTEQPLPVDRSHRRRLSARWNIAGKPGSERCTNRKACAVMILALKKG
jgi:hypothetical protein